ncbi:MAG: DNA polymerase I [Pirellulales bacterium]
MPPSTRQTRLPGWDDADEAASIPARPATEPAVGEAIESRAESNALDSATSEPAPGQTIYLVDANNLIFQVFHAIPEMSSPRGEPVNAVFGFTRDLLFLLEKKQPDYLIVAFDPPGDTFRHALDAAYKGQRSEMPVDLRPQFAAIRRVLAALRIPAVELTGYEADDVLATLAYRGAAAGADCYLVTGDKDCRQLISERVQIFNVRKNQLYDAAALAADWGVRPEQVVDYQALVGDSVDNVPGVPGVGPKTAAELIRQFGSLDALLAGLDQVNGAKKRDNLAAHRDQALRCRELVRLETNMPLEFDWRSGRVDGVDQAGLAALFTEFGFHSFAARFGALDLKPAAAEWQARYHTVDTPEELAQLVDQLGQQTQISLHTLTTSANPRSAEIIGFAFAWRPGEAWYVPVRAPLGDRALDLPQSLAALRPVLENPRIAKVGQNLKVDRVVLRGHGVELSGIAFDAMLASYLLDAGERNHTLDELARRYLNHDPRKLADLTGTGKNQRPLELAPVALVAEYAAETADVALRLEQSLAPKLAANELAPLFAELETPLLDVLAELEFNGMRIDTARLGELSVQYQGRIEQLEREIHELAGRAFNIASPKQLAEVLFAEQRLPVLKKTKTGPSTDADVLEELALLHPLPAKIIEFRQYAKLKGTYVDALPLLVNPSTGRVHASFNQGVAATGRLSSSDPNLQNIPVRTAEGREIRSAFLPGADDWVLLTADYSQIELRILAHYSQDAALCEAFARGDDIHALVASQVNGVALDRVTKDQRRAAKAVNFGVVYGQSAFGLAKQLGIEQAEAGAFIDAYFSRYPGVEAFMDQTLAAARRNGYVTTILGRRRAIAGVRDGRSSAGRQRNLAERTAINTVIQGSAADLIKKAMLAVHAHLQATGFPARMLLQIHDELVFEVERARAEEMGRWLAPLMESVLPLSVPLGVDVKVGSTWAACEPL